MIEPHLCHQPWHASPLSFMVHLSESWHAHRLRIIVLSIQNHVLKKFLYVQLYVIHHVHEHQ